jgi:hypothetical protein
MARPTVATLFTGRIPNDTSALGGRQGVGAADAAAADVGAGGAGDRLLSVFVAMAVSP